MRTSIAIVCVGFSLAGCTSYKTPPVSQSERGAKPVVTADLRPVGMIVLVNAQARFAVVNFPTGPVPSVGQILSVYHKGLKAAALKVTGPQRENITVGDILEGQPQAHDEVREE